jgi:hypothetical protein
VVCARATAADKATEVIKKFQRMILDLKMRRRHFKFVRLQNTCRAAFLVVVDVSPDTPTAPSTRFSYF